MCIRDSHQTVVELRVTWVKTYNNKYSLAFYSLLYYIFFTCKIARYPCNYEASLALRKTKPFSTPKTM